MICAPAEERHPESSAAKAERRRRLGRRGRRRSPYQKEPTRTLYPHSLTAAQPHPADYPRIQLLTIVRKTFQRGPASGARGPNWFRSLGRATKLATRHFIISLKNNAPEKSVS